MSSFILKEEIKKRKKEEQGKKRTRTRRFTKTKRKRENPVIPLPNLWSLHMSLETTCLIPFFMSLVCMYVCINSTRKWYHKAYVYVWVILFSIMSSNSIHAATNGMVFSFLWLSNIPVHLSVYLSLFISSIYIIYHISIIYLPIIYPSFIHLSFVYMYLSIYLSSIYLFIYLSSIHLSICLSSIFYSTISLSINL